MCRAITEGRALDVIEVDAASNRRIEEIRDLREKVNYAPNLARRKVYIIDEVHVLSYGFQLDAMLFQFLCDYDAMPGVTGKSVKGMANENVYSLSPYQFPQLVQFWPL